MSAILNQAKAASTTLLRKMQRADKHLAVGLFVILSVGVAVGYVFHPDGGFTRGGLIHGDGVYHYAALRSLLFDGDFNLSNDYALVGNPYRYGSGPTGLPISRFSIGPALLWAPFFAVAHALATLGVAAGWWHDTLTGESAFYQRMALIGSPVAALTTVVFAYREVLRFFGRRRALVGCAGLCLATPWLWYAIYQPSYSHAASGLGMACVVVCCRRLTADARFRVWFYAGLAVGATMLMRVQDGMIGLLVVAVWIRGLAGKSVWQNAGCLAACSCATVLAFAPQMAMWQAIYGKLLVQVQGDGFMLWHASQWANTLGSTRNGLFAFHPWLGLAVVVALVAGCRRQLSALEGWGLLFLAVQAYINGAAYDWWGGWAFGGRRYLGLALFFAVFFARSWSSHRIVQPCLIVLGAAALWFNAGLMHDYFWRSFEPGQSVDMRPIWQRRFGDWTGEVHRIVGHPGSWPLNLIFAWQSGADAGDFDRVSGRELARYKGFERGDEDVDLRRFGVQGFRGWSSQTAPKAAARRSLAGRVTLALPLRRAYHGHLLVTLKVAQAEEVEVRLNGNELAALHLNPGMNRVDLELPAVVTCAGINILHFDTQQEWVWSVPHLRVELSD